MGFRKWLGNKLFNIDKVVDNRMGQLLGKYDNVNNSALQDYRKHEYKTWATSNPASLLDFYNRTQEPTMYANRFVFWKWIGSSGIKVPKLHYPAPEMLMNANKSLLFGNEIDILFSSTKDSEHKRAEELNKRVDDMKHDIEFNEKMQTSSDFETYSGTVAYKFVLDSEVYNKPIVQVYPAERIELNTKYGKVIEIIFKDYYKVKDKRYTLHSIYGRGYIDYKLLNDKGKLVPLATVEELSELSKVEFSVNKIMAVYKKNRTNSNEFPDSPFGGSDFEGITDLFHSIDEAYSSMMLYIRRNRTITSVKEALLPSSADGSRNIVPKEFEFDFIKLKDKDSANAVDNKIFRDTPKLDIKPFKETIETLTATMYNKVGYDLSSVGLEGVGANMSGEALMQKEKQTQITYNNKVQGWIQTLKEFTRIYLIYEDLLEQGSIDNKYTIKDLYEDIELDVLFPEYNAQTFKEQVSELKEARDAGLIDLATAQYRLLAKEYGQDKLDEILFNSKIEKAIPLVSSQLEREDD